MNRFQTPVVAGAGACTAVGLTAASSAAAVRAGIARLTEHPWIVDNAGEPVIVARVPGVLEPNTPVTERIARLATHAAAQCLEALPFRADAMRLQLVVGLPSARPGLSEDLESQVIAALNSGLEGIRLSRPRIVRDGHSAGLLALGEAREMILTGEADVVLAGASDSYLGAKTLEWLDAQEQLHSPDNPWGFVPGEAGCFCGLVSERWAQSHGVRSVASIDALASGMETKLIKTDGICIGEGLTAAIDAVTASSGELVDQTICDMNGERYRADEYGFASVRLSDRLRRGSEFETPASCWGDVGAASGALFAALTLASAQRGYARGTRYLLWTSSEQGTRCAALLGVRTAVWG